MTCSKCECEFNEVTDFAITYKGEYVCEDCNDDIPSVTVHACGQPKILFSGHGEFSGEEIGTRFYKKSCEARKRILEMVYKQWACTDPIFD